MKPAEKAEDLLHRYDVLQTYIEGFNLENAKQCALIAVDEVIEALHEHHWQNRLIIDYWQEVKHEINKL